MITYRINSPDFINFDHPAAAALKKYEDQTFNFNEDFDIVKIFSFTLTSYDYRNENPETGITIRGNMKIKIKYLVQNNGINEERIKQAILSFQYERTFHLDNGLNDFSFLTFDNNQCNALLFEEDNLVPESIRDIETSVILIFSAFYKYLCENTKVDFYEGKNKFWKILGQDIIGKGLTSEAAFNMFSVGSQNVIAKSFREDEDNTTQKALETSLADINIYPKPVQGEINDILLDGAFRISYK